jgi:hypothetical protein
MQFFEKLAQLIRDNLLIGNRQLHEDVAPQTFARDHTVDQAVVRFIERGGNLKRDVVLQRP